MTAALAGVALVATGLCAAALAVAHLAPTGYRPVENAVSDYGVGRFRLLYWINAIALGVAGASLAAALARSVDPTPTTVVGLLSAFALARLLIPLFPTDLDRSAPTQRGLVHILLAGVAFATIAVAAAKLPDAVRSSPGWDGIRPYLRALGWAVVATGIATGAAVSRALRATLGRYFGLVERVFYAATLTWFAVVSIHLI